MAAGGKSPIWTWSLTTAPLRPGQFGKGFLVVTSRVFRFAQQSFETLIENLLDDPSNMGWTFAELRALAKDLDLDFDELCRKGTPFEQERFKRLEEKP